MISKKRLKGGGGKVKRNGCDGERGTSTKHQKSRAARAITRQNDEQAYSLKFQKKKEVTVNKGPGGGVRGGRFFNFR